jgi:hypothetical protein
LASEISDDVGPDGRGQTSIRLRLSDRRDKACGCHRLGLRNFLEAGPEMLLDKKLNLLAGNLHRPFDQAGIHKYSLAAECIELRNVRSTMARCHLDRLRL